MNVLKKKSEKHLEVTYIITTFALAIKQHAYGTLADRLGNGLQNRVEQFDSARYLNKKTELL